MRRHLLLVRHAKSAWKDPSLADHERPLAPRGIKALPRMGDHLALATHPPFARDVTTGSWEQIGFGTTGGPEPDLFIFSTVFVARARRGTHPEVT